MKYLTRNADLQIQKSGLCSQGVEGNEMADSIANQGLNTERLHEGLAEILG